SETHYRSRFVPNAVVVACLCPKSVLPRTKLGVVRPTARSHVLPVIIDTLQFIAEENPLGDCKVQSCVVDLEILSTCWKSQAVRSRIGLSVPGDRRNYDGGRHAISIFFECRRIQPRDAFDSRKPQSSVRGFHKRRLWQYFPGKPGQTIQFIEALSGNR